MSNEETSAVVYNCKYDDILQDAFKKESGLVREVEVINEEWSVAYLNDPWYNDDITEKQLAQVSLSAPLLHYFYDEGTFYFSGYRIYAKGKIVASFGEDEEFYLIESDELSNKEMMIIKKGFKYANPKEFSLFSLGSSNLATIAERLNSDYIINNWHYDIIIDIHDWLPDVLNINQVCSYS